MKEVVIRKCNYKSYRTPPSTASNLTNGEASENKESPQGIDSIQPTMKLNIVLTPLYHQERDNLTQYYIWLVPTTQHCQSWLSKKDKHIT